MSFEPEIQRPAYLPPDEAPRRPRVALMGEFSAGKSTLANLMIGTDPLPMQVVATQLPPVWISHGQGETVIVDLEGNETPCDLKTVRNLVPDDVAYIRFQCDEEILQMCDIIDMPGISDPNMSPDVWERIMPAADAVIWCSPSTQAWRQSEAAVWEGMDARVHGNSMLLLTRSDMLLTERDKAKVLKRVRNETEGLFSHVQLISLLQARDAQDDAEVLHRSGADEFVQTFLDLLDRLQKEINGADHAFHSPLAPAADKGTVSPDDEAAGESKVVPRRPVAKTSQRKAANDDQNSPPDLSKFTPKFS